VSGLLGGHSGLNIAEGRGNAVQMCAATAAAVLRAVPGARLAALRGGDKRNAIAREASAALLVPGGAPAEAAAAAVVAAAAAAYAQEYGTLEKGLSLALSPAAGGGPPTCLPPADAARLLALVRGLPHGALKASHAVPGLVETSNNVASVASTPDGAGGVRFLIITSTRSSLAPALEAVRDTIEALAALAGGSVERGKAYPGAAAAAAAAAGAPRLLSSSARSRRRHAAAPTAAGWAPDPSSAVLAVARAAMAETLGAEPKVGAIHAVRAALGAAAALGPAAAGGRRQQLRRSRLRPR